jgi:hypothetical protein
MQNLVMSAANESQVFELVFPAQSQGLYVMNLEPSSLRAPDSLR